MVLTSLLITWMTISCILSKFSDDVKTVGEFEVFPLIVPWMGQGTELTRTSRNSTEGNALYACGGISP